MSQISFDAVLIEPGKQWLKFCLSFIPFVLFFFFFLGSSCLLGGPYSAVAWSGPLIRDGCLYG